MTSSLKGLTLEYKACAYFTNATTSRGGVFAVNSQTEGPGTLTTSTLVAVAGTTGYSITTTTTGASYYYSLADITIIDQ
jgi:hypothetical protein